VLVGLATLVGGWDLRKRVIPNLLVGAGAGAGLILAGADGWTGLRLALSGAVVWGGPMTILWLVGAASRGTGLVGAGDAKAALAFGTVLGMPAAMAGLWWGALAGAVLALVAVAVGLWQARASLVATFKRRGAGACLLAIAAEPVWSRGIPYGLALSVGAILAAASAWS
jgi:Flp pilus assembly protein protease CpaA